MSEVFLNIPIIKKATLAQSIQQKVSSDNPPENKPFNSYSHGIQLIMLNKTQFSIEVNSTYFDSTVGWDFGKYLDTPRTIEPCSRMIYSVVNKSYFGAFAGVSGGTGFKLKLEGASEDWYFTVGFHDPIGRQYQASVQEGTSGKEAYEKCKLGSSSGSSSKTFVGYAAEDLKKEKQVKIKFAVETTAGQNQFVTIRQDYV